MKIQAIKKLCMDRRAFYIFNCSRGQQFLGNGVALWPVDGFQLTASMIPALFDISEKEKEKLTIREIEAIDERYTMEPGPEEEPLKDLGTIWHAGRFFRALEGSEGVLFIDTALTKPGEDRDGKFVYALRKRPGDTVPIVACYGDMLASAIVLPEIGREMMERLEEIAGKPLHVFWGEEQEG